MAASVETLREKIRSRTARTGVVGLGYVGLPLAVELAKAGFHATGIDLDDRKVQSINDGRSYIPDVATADVQALRAKGLLDATTDFSVVKDLDTINICVPTPLRKTKDPDMSYIVSAVEGIAKYLHPGMLIVLESTTYPGTTDEVVQPMLEAKGLKAGVDFFLAFSPERVDPGNPTFQTHNVPKVVGGFSPACSQLAAELYGTAIETIVPVSSTRVAEMVKLLENTFRAVNIGLVNELALMCDRMNINVWEVVDAAKTKPFGFMPFYPGPRPRRPLHPDRSVLPVVEGEADRLRSAVHRAGRPHQRRHAALRRRQGRRSAERRGARRSTARTCSSPASPTSATSTTCASRRRWT